MKQENLWNRAETLHIQSAAEIVGGFDIGFDKGIPEETKDALMRFVYWVENHYSLPVTLWVDFKNKHYLLDPARKRVGYRFYWAEFKNYPVFDNPDDIPVIELPVRTGHRTMEEILTSFIEAISHYFAWLANAYSADYKPKLELVEAILQAYLKGE